MSTVLQEPDVREEIETLAELVEWLGGIPLDRIRFHPAPGTATEDDVIAALEAPRKRICELIDGVLVEKAMGYRESVLASLIIELLNAWVRPRNFGLVSAPDGTLRLWAGRVRIPDVAFTSWDRMPGRKRPTKPIPELSPDIAVEVLSDSNTYGEMQLKLADYFAAHVRLVWIVDPELRTVEVYTGAGQMTLLRQDDTLDGGAVLPGFVIPLKDLFAELDRQG
jgi:Uma2 family endonuclease